MWRSVKCCQQHSSKITLFSQAIRKIGNSEHTHFGYQSVPKEEKEEKVHDVFASVADNYDVMNDVMSCGLHRFWKDQFIERIGPRSDTTLIDVAGGTGDIAFRFLSYKTGIPSNEKVRHSDRARVTVCDINSAMLDVGRSRANKLGLDENELQWIEGNAENLSFGNDSFDVYTIAYGIRNCTNITKVLSEAYRVLKPGGRFMCLEFGALSNALLQRLYDAYSFQVLPPLGQLIARDWDSYQYLVESIRKFPKQENFKKMISEANFHYVYHENQSFGISVIYSAIKGK